MLLPRLRRALAVINPSIPQEALEDAIKQVTTAETPNLTEENRRIHKLMTDGVSIEYRSKDGRIVGDTVWLIDFTDIEKNDWLVLNQFTVIEARNNRRPDVVCFINGLPVAVIELKNPADENATLTSAFNQLQTYKAQIPSLFQTNNVMITSDGMLARIGSLTAQDCLLYTSPSPRDS